MAAKAKTPLNAAIGGDVDKLNDKQTRSALSDAIGKLSRFEKLANTSKEAVADTGMALMHSAETMGSLFLSSMAEGFIGPEKMRMGGVDLRAPAGLLLQGYGLYQTLSGEGGSEHFLAIGNGVTGSWLASVGQDAGRALRERRSGTAPAQTPAAPPNSSFRGEEPMVHIPEIEGGYGPGGFGAPFAGPGLAIPHYHGFAGGSPNSQSWPGTPSWQGASSPNMGAQPWQGMPTGNYPHSPAQAGLLPPPPPPQYQQSPSSWSQGHPNPYAPTGQPVYESPVRLSGPVREILPVDLEPYSGPSPYPGHATTQAPIAGHPGDPATFNGSGVPPYGMHSSPAAGAQVAGRPIMRFTPEGPAQSPGLRMRFTPETAQPSGTTPESSASSAAYNDHEADGGIAGPRFLAARMARRAGQDNPFPRAQRAIDSDEE